MFRLQVLSLIKDLGIKKIFIIDLIGSNKVTFDKKLRGETEFTKKERRIIKEKYNI